MIVVIDTNVIVSAILRKSTTQRILFNPAFRFYAPEFVWAEIAKHRKEFIEKTGYTEDEFGNAVYLAFSNLTIVPEDEYGKFRNEALSFSPDKEDWPFLALALHLNAPLWSFDKELKEKQKKVKVLSVEELLALAE